MKSELEEDPAAFLRDALPPSVAESLPDEIGDLIEKPAEVAGELEVSIAEDFESGHVEMRYRVKADSEDPGIAVKFLKAPEGIRTGDVVAVAGVAVGGAIASDGGASSVQVVAPSTAEAAVAGARRAVVLCVNFQDKALECSVASVHSLVFGDAGSVNRCYLDASFGQFSFYGDTFGPFTIPYSSTGSCSDSTWAGAVDEAVNAAGIDLGTYNHKIYVFPKDANCSYSGLGSIGGGWSYILGFCQHGDAIAHELGHNLGIHHLSTPTNEYGDMSDIMGYGGVGLRHLNAPHKMEMGWLPASRVLAIDAPGFYKATVSILETTDGSSVQAIEVPDSSGTTRYYFEHRQPVGIDASGLLSQYWNKTLVHTWSGESGAKTYLLAMLADGQTFSDAATGMAVTQMSHDLYTGTASLSITYGGPASTPRAPALSLSPTSQSGPAGRAQSYTVTVTDRDSPACSAATFTLSAAVPEGWSSIFSPVSLTLSPGSCGSATWTVTPPAGTPDGTYNLPVRVSDAGSATHVVEGSATFVVFTDPTPPAAQISSPLDGSSIPKNGRVKVQGSATDNTRVTKMEAFIDGASVASASASSISFTWNVRSVAAGAHTVTVKAYDAAGNSSTASATVVK
jgi:hypothetical protein